MAIAIAWLLCVQPFTSNLEVGAFAAALRAAPADILVVCSAPSVRPAPSSHRRQPRSHPDSSSWSVAAPSIERTAAINETPTFDTQISFDAAAIVYTRFVERFFVPRLKRRIGDPRAPPALSV